MLQKLEIPRKIPRPTPVTEPGQLQFKLLDPSHLRDALDFADRVGLGESLAVAICSTIRTAASYTAAMTAGEKVELILLPDIAGHDEADLRFSIMNVATGRPLLVGGIHLDRDSRCFRVHT